jgi:D-glycerate 3-kinase
MRNNFKKIQEEVRQATNGVIIKPKTFKKSYLPLIEYYISDRKKKKIKTYVIGVQGCQGVGKTVLTSLLKVYLKSAGYKVVGFSIDDFYKSYADRQKFLKQNNNNPFYKVRGLPGTHYFEKMYNALMQAKTGKNFYVPEFDKSLCKGNGDVANKTTKVNERQDFIILEGWCVNIPNAPTNKFPLIMKKNKYVNKIFNELDPKREHYKAVLNYIKKYQKIWKLLDNKTIMLGKNIKWVEEWRIEQEKKMIKKTKNGMAVKKIKEFIKPYIPFTYLYYDKLNKKDVNCLLTIGKNHLPEKIEYFS